MLLLGIITFLFFIYLAYKNPVLSLGALSAILPTYLLRFNIIGLPSNILEVIIWAIFLGWLFGILPFLRPRPSKALNEGGWRESLSFLKKRLHYIKWPLGLFFIASIIAVFISPEKISALGIWRAYFLEAGLVFLLFLSIIKDKKDFQKIIFGLSVSALYLSAAAIGQRFFGLPIPSPWQDELRATSLFPYPNALGLYLAPLIMLFIHQIINNKKLLITGYWLLVALLSLAAIIFAQSDGAIFAIIGAGFLFILLNLLLNKKYKSGLVILLLVLIAGGILFTALQPIQEKILLKDWSGFVRFTMWGETLNMLKDNWFFGAGLAGYKTAIVPFHESREWIEIYLYPHNIILNFWSELGLLGLAALIWLFDKFAKMCYALLKSPPLGKRRVRGNLFAITAICAMAVIIIQGLVDVPYFKNDLSVLFWIIFSMPLISYKP